jgi:ABC-2 type transport system ATP-binding protein
MSQDQARPAAAYSQPIGLAGSRNVMTSPMVAKPSGKASAKAAPWASTPSVSGRVRARVTTRPAAQQPKVTSHNDQASLVLVRACSFTVWSSAREGLTPANAGRATVRDRYGPAPRRPNAQDLLIRVRASRLRPRIGGMALLDVCDVTKRFGAVTAVDGVSLQVGPGEVVGLLGPNGAGKTTTLHMVLGLVTPDAGEVRLFGERLDADRTALLGRLNFAAGYVNLPGVLTVEEVLRVFAHLYGVRDVPGRVAALLAQLELDELRRRPMRLLSSGQQTHVQLAKALVNEPELLVLDEPTASLDPDVGDRVRALLLRLARDSGRAMLITSHNMREIERMCDRIEFVAAGRIVAAGSAPELADRYGVDDLEAVFLRVARG